MRLLEINRPFGTALRLSRQLRLQCKTAFGYHFTVCISSLDRIAAEYADIFSSLWRSSRMSALRKIGLITSKLGVKPESYGYVYHFDTRINLKQRVERLKARYFITTFSKQHVFNSANLTNSTGPQTYIWLGFHWSLICIGVCFFSCSLSYQNLQTVGRLRFYGITVVQTLSYVSFMLRCVSSH